MPDHRADGSALRLVEGARVTVHVGDRGDLLPVTRVGIVVLLPDDDDDERQQHRVDDADDRDHETGDVVVGDELVVGDQPPEQDVRGARCDRRTRPEHRQNDPVGARIQVHEAGPSGDSPAGTSLGDEVEERLQVVGVDLDADAVAVVVRVVEVGAAGHH